VRAGCTFRYTPEGPIGLLRDKRAVLLLTRGGIRSGGPARVRDYQEPDLCTLLAFVGITEVSTVLAEGLKMRRKARNVALRRHEPQSPVGLRAPLSAIARLLEGHWERRVSGSL
jgi:FMN-dependent NADH-azoreductase